MKIWPIAVIFIAILYFNVQQQFHPQVKFNALKDRILHPFDHRLRYRIGTVDPRFNISREKVIELSHQASDIWFMGTQQNFFVYDPTAKLSINLIYDQRQEDSNARKSAIYQIENSKYSYQQEHQRLTDLYQQLNQYKRKIAELEESYRSNVQMYNQWANTINRNQQGRDPAALARLEEYRDQLQVAQDRIREEIEFFNMQVSEINQQVGVVNTLQNHFNSSVNQFNHQFQPRQFDKGLFNGREINIYEINSEADLKITIAHELGHALGILHTNDPTSLMYPIMEKQNLDNFSLSQADITLLNDRR